MRTEDNRVPPEARRMAASPYGPADRTAARRPGTRPQQAVRRPVQEPRRIAPEPKRAPVDFLKDENISAGMEADSTRSFNSSRISVGYAPGQMAQNQRTAPDPRHNEHLYKP